MQAVGTGYGRVARVNMQYAHAGGLCLVLDQLLELAERPRVEGAALAPAEPATVPDAFEHLKDDGQAVLFGVGDKLLADRVVDSFLVASLPTRKPFECPTTCFARLLAAGVCLRLQPRPDVGAAMAIVGEVLPLKRMSCRIGGNVADAQIHAQCIVNLIVVGRVGCFLFYLNVKVIAALATFLEGGRGWVLTGQPFSLEVAQQERTLETTIEQTQADHLGFDVELEDASVVVDARGLEPAVPRLGLGQPGCNPSDSTDRQVGRQTKPFTYVAVAALMQIILAMLFVFVAPISHEVAGLGKRLKRRVNTSRYRRRNRQATREGTYRFHILTI